VFVAQHTLMVLAIVAVKTSIIFLPIIKQTETHRVLCSCPCKHIHKKCISWPSYKAMVICIYRQRQFSVFNNAQNAKCFGLHDHYQVYTHIILKSQWNTLRVLEFARSRIFYKNRNNGPFGILFCVSSC